MQKDLNINNLTVMPGKILAEILSNLETTAGGIILATVQRKKEIPQKARVLKVGAAKRDVKGKLLEPVAKVGEIIYFKRHFGFKWKEEWREYIFLKREEITGVSDE